MGFTCKHIRIVLLATLGIAWTGARMDAQLISTKPPLPTPVQIMMHMDSMMQTWEVQDGLSGLSETNQTSETGQTFSDAKIASQLRTLQGEMEFKFHHRIRYFIELFTEKKKFQTGVLLALEKAYLAQVNLELQERRLPSQLRHLPAVLSAYNPQATNSLGGAGLWQLNYHTALRYGLECNETLDERRDPTRSTAAALSYILDLKARFKTWTPTLLAFTCGPASLQKARLRAGEGADFEALYPHLPEATRDYFPAFVAMSYLSQYARAYGIDVPRLKLENDKRRIPIERALRLSTVAKALAVSQSELEALNPELRGDIVCVAGESGTICLPASQVNAFNNKREQIFALEADSKPTPPSEPEVAKEVKTTPAKPKPVGPPPNTTKVVYTIQPGDNLGAISRNHGVKIADLQAWNGISGTLIKAGDKINIYVAKGFTPKTTTEPNVAEKAKPKKTNTKYESYTVKTGDTLWGISQKYPGVSADDIMAANKIGADIKPGQVLKIPTAQ